jgi:hypothetical protein
MVLMCNRRTEKGHDPVTKHLVYGAFIAVNRFHHKTEDRVQEFPGLFGSSIGDQFHRPLEIGKEYGNELAFAFNGGAGGEDLVGKVFGGVGLGGGEIISAHLS